MERVLKYGLLCLAVILVVWAIWFFLHPAADGSTDEEFLVVLDPGHGGSDPGAMVGETMEKDINLAVALLVRDQLEKQDGVKVLITREEDVLMTMADRVELANRKQADLYVSIHSNSLEDDSFQGIMTFYWTEQSKAAAQAIQSAVLSSTKAVDRNVRTEEYVVLRDTEMPSVLIEMGFMTCPDELERLTDPVYQKLLAQGIVQGILACQKI